MNVKSRAHRILKRMANYQNLATTIIDSQVWLQGIQLQENEEYVGVYKNQLEHREESIVVTTLGLHIFRRGEWEFIRYDSIRFVEPPSEKQSADSLSLMLLNGQSKDVPVKGKSGNFPDVFEFLRFLNRVILDFK